MVTIQSVMLGDFIASLPLLIPSGTAHCKNKQVVFTYRMKCSKCPKILSLLNLRRQFELNLRLSQLVSNQLVLLVCTSWACLLWCCDVIYFSDLVVPLSCVKVQLQSVTEMDSLLIFLTNLLRHTHSVTDTLQQPLGFPSFPS